MEAKSFQEFFFGRDIFKQGLKGKQTLLWDKKWHEHKYRFFKKWWLFRKKMVNEAEPVVILLAVTRKRC